MPESQTSSTLKPSSPFATFSPSSRKPFTPVSNSKKYQIDHSVLMSSNKVATSTITTSSQTTFTPPRHRAGQLQEPDQPREVETEQMQRSGIQALQAQRQRVDEEEEQKKLRERELKEKKRREKEKEEREKRESEDVEMGGIYSLTDKQLGERWNFEEEIGFGNWGSVWRCTMLQGNHPSSRSRSNSTSDGSGSNLVPPQEQMVAKLCHRSRTGPSQARVRSLWNEFKVLRGVASSVRAERRRRNGRAGDGDESGDLSSSLAGNKENDPDWWHPNIVKFKEFIISPSYASLHMNYYPQPMNVALPEHIYRDYFQGLASGLFWLHSNNCTHNDIKTSNIVISQSSSCEWGVPILLDFGFAVLHSRDGGTSNFGAGGGSSVSSKRGQNEDGSKKDPEPKKLKPFFSQQSWGTPEYLAPERARGDVHDERASDAWSLGVTFFEIATGRTPFESESEQFLTPEALKVYYARTANSEWQGTWDNLSSEFVELVSGLLHVNPKERMTLPDAMLSPFFDPLSEKDEGDRSVGRLLGGESSLEREIGELRNEDEQERRDNSHRHDRDGSISRMSHRGKESDQEASSRRGSSISSERDTSPGLESVMKAYQDGSNSMQTDLVGDASAWKNMETSRSYPRLEATNLSKVSAEGDVSDLNLGTQVNSASKAHPYLPRRSSPLKPGLRASESDDEEPDGASIPSALSTPSVTPIQFPQHSSPAPKVLKDKTNLPKQKSPPTPSEKLAMGVESSLPRTPPSTNRARPLSFGSAPRPRSPTVQDQGQSPIAEVTSSSSFTGNKTPLRNALRNAAFAAARKLSPSSGAEQRSPVITNRGFESPAPGNQLPVSPSPVRIKTTAPEASRQGGVRKGLQESPALPPSPTKSTVQVSQVKVATPSVAEGRRNSSLASSNSIRSKTAGALRAAVRSAERRALSPPVVESSRRNTLEEHGSLLSATTNSTAPPKYDEVQRHQSLESHQSSERESQSGSEPVSIPARDPMEDSLTFKYDDEESSEDEGNSTLEREDDEDPTCRQNAAAAGGGQGQSRGELQPVYLHQPRQDEAPLNQPRRMSSNFGISKPFSNPISKPQEVKRKQVPAALEEESPEMTGWGVQERSNGEFQSPPRRNQGHRRTQTAPSEISVSSIELEERLTQMAQLAATLTQVVEETRKSFRDGTSSSQTEHDLLQAQIKQAQALLAMSQAPQEGGAGLDSHEIPRSQAGETSNETSSSQISRVTSVDSFNQSSSDRHVAFREKIGHFSPDSTPGLEFVSGGRKQQNSFAFPSISSSTASKDMERAPGLKIPSNGQPQSGSSRTNSYGEGLEGYNSDSRQENSSHQMTSSQTDVSQPVSAPSLTSASSFEAGQPPSLSLSSSRARSQRARKENSDFTFPSKIPILSERRKPSAAFSYNTTPKRPSLDEEEEDGVLVVASPRSRIPTSNRNSYIYTKTKNTGQPYVPETPRTAQRNESNFSRKVLADGSSVRRQGKGFTGRPTTTVATSAETASREFNHSDHNSKTNRFGSVGSKVGRMASGLTRFNSSGASLVGTGSNPNSKATGASAAFPSQGPRGHRRVPSQDQTLPGYMGDAPNSRLPNGKGPATPARGGALWRLLRGVAVKSKEMQRTV